MRPSPTRCAFVDLRYAGVRTLLRDWQLFRGLAAIDLLFAIPVQLLPRKSYDRRSILHECPRPRVESLVERHRLILFPSDLLQLGLSWHLEPRPARL